MSATPSALDTASKRWLAVLVVVFLASIAILARSFVKTTENIITLEPRASGATEQVATRTEPVWDNPQTVHEVEQTQPVGRISPFAAWDVAEARDNPALPPESCSVLRLGRGEPLFPIG